MLKTEVFIFRFRPSSHSSEYTIVATYRSVEDAEKTYRRLRRFLENVKEKPNKHGNRDWDVEDVCLGREGERLVFSVYSADSFGEVVDVMGARKPKGVKTYRNDQKLMVKVEVSRGLSLEAATLILPEDEVAALRDLWEICGEPRVEGTEAPEVQHLVFEVDGSHLLSGKWLHIGRGIDLTEKRNWKVSLAGVEVECPA